ncbi:type II secretion system protein GspM [Legionella londiniensis]|uniref:Putative general secretion pathway protein YghD n=1 Tax=Legionella londiniensis TaxID=45068 RepID=A0A0W0VP71_9GAMM|nr:type II secretion system protein GspM [Legionella londiniensis]KTD21915.1 putative general secretion pathway protein YghD [Legionella londiniensis]STX92602.1 general secretion pathway protein M [Legionella londiniensis]
MMEYWRNLNDRERLALMLGGFFCLFYLIYLLIYSPLVTVIKNRSQALTEKKETLIWMRRIKLQYQPNQAGKKISNAQFLALLSRKLADSPVQDYSYQLQQTGAGDVQAAFDEVPFNPFLQWLFALNQEYALSIKELNVERTGSPGIVKLLLVVSAA